MSSETNKEAVFNTTKVRAKLKGDSSWMNRNSSSETKTTTDKPWLAEVRASRPNGAFTATSPVTSPTKPIAPPTVTSPTKPTAPPTKFGTQSGSTFVKKHSDSYKKIAPHTVRPISDSQVGQLSKDEQERRTEAAGNVLNKSSVKQRSYVLSAAKKFESRQEPANISTIQSSSPFVAKRVEIYDDDDDDAPSPVEPTRTPPPSPVNPFASGPTPPQPQPRKIGDSRVKSAVEAFDQLAAQNEEDQSFQKPEEEDVRPAPVSVIQADPFEQLTPGCTKVDTPLPVLILDSVQTEPGNSVRADTLLVDLSSAQEPTISEPTAPMSPTPVSPIPLTPAPVSTLTDITVSTEPEPSASVFTVTDIIVTKESEPSAPVSDVTATKELELEPPSLVSTVTDIIVTKELEPEPSTLKSAVTDVKVTPESEPSAPVTSVTDNTVMTEPEPSASVFTVTDIIVTKESEPEPSTLTSTVTDIKVTPEPEPSALVTTVTEITVIKEPELGLSFPTSVMDTVETKEPESSTSMFTVTEITTTTDPEPSASVSTLTDILVNTEPEPQPSPKPRFETLSALSDTLISFYTSSHSVKDGEPELAQEEGGAEDTHATNYRIEPEPVPEISNCVPMTDDLLVLNGSPEAPAEPVPSSPGRWSQDLLGGLDSDPYPEQTGSALDLLSNDVITVHTETRSLSTQQEEENPTEETDKEMQSSTETVTITTKTVIITDKSMGDSADPWSSHVTTTVTESRPADPFDPYPIGTTSLNSSSDLFQPRSDVSLNSPEETQTITNITTIRETQSQPEPTVDRQLPTTEKQDPSSASVVGTHRWALTWDTSTPKQEDPAVGHVADQTMLVTFERKSTENDSPWDRWTSPTLYNIATEEEEEQEQSPEKTQMQTITTITTIRETQSQPEPTVDRYETYSRSATVEEQDVKTPEPEPKKAFVYVKEYINSTELSLRNARDTYYDGADYFTSSSSSQSYSSPSSYTSSSPSSTCTYCGELVGNDAKISIDHLNIHSHPACFKCGVCGKPMGDLLDSMFLHTGKVHCETCYAKAFD